MGNCKAPTEVYSRVVGYYRPVQHWNPGKQAEFHDRVPYAINGGTMTPNNSKSTHPIPCANCLHCKVYLERADRGPKVERRVKCAMGNWQTPSGKERTYCYHTVLGRRMVSCPDYDSMGEHDRDEFLKSLRDNLPVEREFVILDRAVGANA